MDSKPFTHSTVCQHEEIILMSRKYGLLAAAVVAIISVAGAPLRPSVAADNVLVKLGETELLTVPVSEFETFAKTGTPPETLAPFTGSVTEQQKKAVQGILSKDIQVKTAPFSQFLESNLGKLILENLGEIIQPSGVSISKVEALRTAVRTAAADGSFNFIELMKSYPKSTIVLDIKPVLKVVQEIDTFRSDLKLMLASAGIDVDTTNFKIDIDALRSLFVSTKLYGEEVYTFIKSTEGVTLEELRASTPPTGTITIQKADLYELFQKLEKLAKEVEAATGVVVDVK